jgi:hypothetical protein
MIARSDISDMCFTMHITLLWTLKFKQDIYLSRETVDTIVGEWKY